MKYKYKAINKKKEEVTGEIVSGSHEQVEKELASQGLTLIGIKEIGKKGSGGLLSKEIGGGMKDIDKIVIFANLSKMLKAGLPVLEALKVLKTGQKRKKVRDIIDEMIFDVSNGSSLSASMSKFPKEFTALDVSVFEVGEAAGTLDTNIMNLSTQLRQQYLLKKKIIGAMWYPAIITVAMVLISLLIIVFLVPRLSGFFDDSGLQLPFTTRALVWTSEFLVNQGLLVAGGLVAFLITFSLVYKKSAKFKHAIDGLILKIPLAGPIVREFNVSRFGNTLGSLLKSGVPVLEGLDIVKRGFTNSIMNEAVGIIQKDVEKGQELYLSMEKIKKIFHPMEISFVKVGGETGTVDESLINVSEHYESEITDVMNNLSSIIEPIMLLVMGVGVVFIALSVFTPIYQLIGNLN